MIDIKHHPPELVGGVGLCCGDGVVHFSAAQMYPQKF